MGWDPPPKYGRARHASHSVPAGVVSLTSLPGAGSGRPQISFILQALILPSFSVSAMCDEGMAKAWGAGVGTGTQAP